MACGIPVVASARTSVPEVCGGAALIVEPYHPEDMTEAMEALLKDLKLRDEMISKGFQRVAKFDWDESARKIYDTFKELNSGELHENRS
jgi:glycosyltransferase involved in cell wall biosynthesis